MSVHTNHTGRLRVLVAPDKFKGSLTAGEAAAAIARATRAALPGAEIVLRSLADGGEGTLEVLQAAGAHTRTCSVQGPLGDRVEARYVVLNDTAYVEAAQACGLQLVDRSTETALRAHTHGVGELIQHAVQYGYRRIVLSVGGTASTDGGAGMLTALGARLTGRGGGASALGGEALHTLERVDLSTVHRRLAGTTVIAATDVTNPLLGPAGAATEFGPQKGAGVHERAVLERGLTNWARLLEAASGHPRAALEPGAGAGGGVGFAALGALGAQGASGLDMIVELTRLRAEIANADLVIVGEGSLDAQSLRGKAPIGVATLARAAGVPTLAVAGRIAVDVTRLREGGIAAASSILDGATAPDVAIRCADQLLSRRTGELLRWWIGSNE